MRSLDAAEQWHSVLAAICEASRARKAIIALRDNTTAELIIPDVVSANLFSPLLYGFTEEQVESYVGHYARFDPWTEIERRYRPVRGYFLSTYLPDARLRASVFWNWLEPQGISDTLVFELERGKHGWVALNLYFDGDDVAAREGVRNVIRQSGPAIRRSWQIFQSLQNYRNGVEISPPFMEAFTSPAMIFNAALDIVALNEKGAARFAAYCGCESALRPGPMPSALRKALASMLHANDGRAHCSMPNDRGEILGIRPIQQSQDMLGRKIGAWLATLDSVKREPSQDNPHIWENPALTQREREVVKAIVDGVSLSTYARTASISVNTAKAYLRDARAKLGGVSSKDLYARKTRT